VAPPRRYPPSARARLKGWLRRLPARVLRGLRASRPVRPVPLPECSLAERALLEAVESTLPMAKLAAAGLCAGGGSPRARGATLWLPRRSPEVRRAAGALEREGGEFARVVALALIPPGDATP
jgi:hypothetical protein